MKVCRSLSNKLAEMSKLYNISESEIWKQILFSVPDEALREYHALQDPVEMELDDEATGLTESMAEDFGMTPLGLTVFMDQIMAKTIKSWQVLTEHEKRTS